MATGKTNVRAQVIAVSMLMAFILYLDRICLAEIVKSESFRSEMALSPMELGRVLGIFFLGYAAVQLPAGWLSDRFGARWMLTGYIMAWSLCTAMTGVVSSFAGLLVARFLCGAAEAGAYPTSAALLRYWVPVRERAAANSMVSMGGRIGGTLAPFLTAWLVVAIGAWRPVLWLDGAVGIAIAGLYWFVVRNRPEEHPRCGAAEQALIGKPVPEARPRLGELLAILRGFVTSRNIWCASAILFLCGLSWSFLFTWLPSYLKDQKHVEAVTGGRMVTLVLACGVAGQIAGGWLADRAAQRAGLRWGRTLMISASGILGGLGYLGCLFAESAWGVVACCGVVSFAVDLGNPAIWAFMQDIGGRITATALGWINMFGNLGAASISVLVPLLVAGGPTRELGQRSVFLVCTIALLLTALLSLGLNATRPLLSGRPSRGVCGSPEKATA